MDALAEMLTRAGIPYGVESPLDDDRYGALNLPKGSHSWIVQSSKQPHEGGYFMFYTEIVFNPDGSLRAIWGWE